MDYASAGDFLNGVYSVFACFQVTLGEYVERRVSSGIDITGAQHLVSDALLLHYVVHCPFCLVERGRDG